MERVKVLIDKLVQQQQHNESAEAMLITAQLLQNELLIYQRKSKPAGTSKVSVVMPSGAGPAIKREIRAEPLPGSVQSPAPAPVEEQTPASVVEEPISAPVFEEPKPEPVVERSPEVVIPEIPEHEAYLPPKQKIEEPEKLKDPEKFKVSEKLEEHENIETPARVPEEKTYIVLQDTQFDAIEETPTLAQYQPSKKDIKVQKEINELIGESRETLNDRLKENKKELAHVLKETPIKDLRKAIGVNDRFVFVNELFRGDETMYERSIKTINGFHILPEAEYWINRELKVKLGWDDYKDSVQHFYHLVRRRFS